MCAKHNEHQQRRNGGLCQCLSCPPAYPVLCRYKGRGLFLSAPTIAMTDGKWHVFPPNSEEPPSEAYQELFLSEKLPSLEHAFEPGRCKGTLAALYETLVVHQLQRQVPDPRDCHAA